MISPTTSLKALTSLVGPLLPLNSLPSPPNLFRKLGAGSTAMNVRAAEAFRAVNAARAVRTLRVAGTVRVARAAIGVLKVRGPSTVQVMDPDHTDNNSVKIILICYPKMVRVRGKSVQFILSKL